MPETEPRKSCRVAAVLVAGGRGSRAGGGVPKQYRPIGGIPMIRRSVEALRRAGIKDIQPVIHPDDRGLFDIALAGGPATLDPAAAGASRRESTLSGLRALRGDPPDLVLIHDAARPFAAPELINRVIAALAAHDGAVPALPVADTLKRSVDGRSCRETVDRSGLWRVQTPQGFRFAAILGAHEAITGDSEIDWTDDAQIAAAAGVEVAMVEGNEDNLKVTAPDDFARAERLADGMPETRTASGFDVHRFGPGNAVTLCGVAIPHSHGLAGHSDADAAWHALTDAILGAIGAGDIGTHFPPSNPAFAGASSDRFLAHAAALLLERGGRIVNVDVTLICERPKVGPHRDAMIASTASVLGIDSSRVSIKATTTERLGFAGREEGIAAQAIATVQLSGR